MFKSLVDIKKDITLREEEFLAVIDEKEQIEVIFNQVIGAKEIDKLLLAKRETLTKQIQ